jgi:uncharacterized FAD-dependent dehydrogenase
MVDKKHVMDLNLNINNKMEKKRIVIVGGGVAGICAATKLVDNGYPGELITVIDMGKDPYKRQPDEVMSGFMGCGLWSDGKLTYHTSIGGQLSKYCGEDKAYDLMDQVIEMVKRFHPKPEAIMYSNPTEEPEFIKPYFGLRLFGVYHIGTDYLHEIGKRWYDYLVEKGVRFYWETKVTKIEFDPKWMDKNQKTGLVHIEGKQFKHPRNAMEYDELIFAVGKSGIDFAQQLAQEYKLPDEPKSVQIGVRFEAPQEHFQKLIDISYDFKLYRKFDDEGVSLRSFCTNNNAAYVAVEETYGDHSYNGHAKKDEAYRNNMTNFGILMEINGIEDPFTWSREVVNKLQLNDTGLYYSPSRQPSTTSEGNNVSAKQISLDTLAHVVEPAMGGYFKYVMDFIMDMKKVFPTLGDDWGIYIPEVKYLSPEVKVNYKDLSLIDYPNVYFVGDALSARGITVSGAQAIYVAENLIKNKNHVKHTNEKVSFS